MTSKEEEVKKVLGEYLIELFEKFDKNKKELEKKQEEANDLMLYENVLFKEIQAVSQLHYKLVSESGETSKTQINNLASLTRPGGYNINKPVSVVEALKIIFRANPTKEFEPVELKDELELIRKKNLLDSEAENLLWISHSALKTLLRDDYIIKNESGSKPTYRKKRALDFDPKYFEKFPIIEKILGAENKEGNDE